MQPAYRDGLLAVVGLVTLVAGAAITVGPEQLLDPVGIGVGIAVAVAIEVVFLQYPSQALALWNRRGVPVVGLCGVLAAGILAVWFVPRVLTVAVWGLGCYLVLLGCVLLGYANPVSVLLRALP